MRIEAYEIYIGLDGGETFNTFGGESSDPDMGESNYYGIQSFGGGDEHFSIGKITPNQMINLGCSIISHLMINGHQFEIKDDRDGNGEYLTIKH
jgi:hypothetical protein